MGFFDSLGRALAQGISNGIKNGMEAQARSRNMSDDQLVNNMFNSSSSWDRAAAQAEIKRRYGNN